MSHSDSPTVSVALPAFNAAATLPDAIRGLQAQTFAAWELVVVDDGSADESTSVVERFAKHDARIVLLQQPHRGIVAALLAGLAKARGRFIARLDADDWCHPSRLAAQVEFLEQHQDIALVSCGVEFGGDACRAEGFARHVDWLNSLVTPEAIALNRFVESPVAHPTVMFRREVLERHGSYRDGPFPEDYELWLRWLDEGLRFAKVPKTLVRWTDSPGRLSRTDPRYAPEAFFAVKARYLARQVRRDRLGRAVWIWGAGRLARRRAALLEVEGIEASGFVDVDRKKWGRLRDGRPVVGPDDVPSPREALVAAYVAKRGARDLIRAHLVNRGYREGRDFWLAA
jgi:glycosyltransferase involved in cell wall biosynthesis